MDEPVHRARALRPALEETRTTAGTGRLVDIQDY